MFQDDRMISFLTAIIIMVAIGTMLQRADGLPDFLKMDSSEPEVVLRDDEIVVQGNMLQRIDVLSNDEEISEVDRNRLKVVGKPSCGRVFVQGDVLQYLAETGCGGPQTIQYTVDGLAGDQVATVRATVIGVPARSRMASRRDRTAETQAQQAASADQQVVLAERNEPDELERSEAEQAPGAEAETPSRAQTAKSPDEPSLPQSQPVVTQRLPSIERPDMAELQADESPVPVGSLTSNVDLTDAAAGMDRPVQQPTAPGGNRNQQIRASRPATPIVPGNRDLEIAAVTPDAPDLPVIDESNVQRGSGDTADAPADSAEQPARPTAAAIDAGPMTNHDTMTTKAPETGHVVWPTQPTEPSVAAQTAPVVAAPSVQRLPGRTERTTSVIAQPDGSQAESTTTQPPPIPTPRFASLASDEDGRPAATAFSSVSQAYSDGTESDQANESAVAMARVQRLSETANKDREDISDARPPDAPTHQTDVASLDDASAPPSREGDPSGLTQIALAHVATPNVPSLTAPSSTGRAVSTIQATALDKVAGRGFDQDAGDSGRTLVAPAGAPQTAGAESSLTTARAPAVSARKRLGAIAESGSVAALDVQPGALASGSGSGDTTRATLAALATVPTVPAEGTSAAEGVSLIPVVQTAPAEPAGDRVVVAALGRVNAALGASPDIAPAPGGARAEVAAAPAGVDDDTRALLQLRPQRIHGATAPVDLGAADAMIEASPAVPSLPQSTDARDFQVAAAPTPAIDVQAISPAMALAISPVDLDQPPPTWAADVDQSQRAPDAATEIAALNPGRPASDVDPRGDAEASDGASSGEKLAALPGADADCVTPPSMTVDIRRAAQTVVSVTAPCHRGTVAELAYSGLRLALPLDAKGKGKVMALGFEANAPALLLFDNGDKIDFDLPFKGVNRVSRVALVWDLPVKLELNALEFGADGYVNPRNPRDFDEIRKSGGGFLTTYRSYAGVGQNAQIFTFWHRKGQSSGIVKLLVDYASRSRERLEGTCDDGAYASPEYVVLRSERGRPEKPVVRRLAALACSSISAATDENILIPGAIDDLVVAD